MAKTNANDQRQALPQKIEQRLAELHSMGEFDQGDLAHCRRSYWAACADWHKILVDCYDAALARYRAAGASTAITRPSTSHPPVPRGARTPAQGVPA